MRVSREHGRQTEGILSPTNNQGRLVGHCRAISPPEKAAK
jgi:hypothetical protein